jgi:hypothetical protein
MSQEQELEKVQLPYEQPLINRPPTPHPFIKPFYVKHQLDSVYSVSSIAGRMEKPQPLSRIELLRSLHKKRKATTIHRLRATRLAITQPLASESTTDNGNNEGVDLPKVMGELVLDNTVNRSMETTGSRCKLCGRSN